MALVNLANSIRQTRSGIAGIPPRSETLFALASGFDVALTIMETSVGLFTGLTPPAAAKVVRYLREEARRCEQISREVAVWYESYAEAIEQLFMSARTGKPFDEQQHDRQ
jgi:hypothetical protein